MVGGGAHTQDAMTTHGHPWWPSDTRGPHWPPIATRGDPQPLMATNGQPWPPMVTQQPLTATNGHLWLPTSIYNHSWLLMSTDICPHLPTFIHSCLWPFMASCVHQCSPNSHPQPPTAIHGHPRWPFHHPWPLISTLGHSEPLMATHGHPQLHMATHSPWWPPVSIQGRCQPAVGCWECTHAVCTDAELAPMQQRHMATAGCASGFSAALIYHLWQLCLWLLGFFFCVYVFSLLILISFTKKQTNKQKNWIKL